MKVILVKDRAAKNGTLCFSGKRLLINGLLIFVALPIGLGLTSYWVVSSIDRSMNPFVDPEYRIAVEGRVNEQQNEILKTRDYVRQHMDVLGRRIGSLQAQVSRINAVEMRLADVSGIDLADFQFDQDPPIGGTEKDLDSEQIDIENAIVAIGEELALRESELSAVDFLLSRKNLQSQQTPQGWPVEKGWISSSFGSRMHPMTGKKQFHRGVDIPGRLGTAVLAVADGVVKRSTKSGNYGWLVELDHGDDYVTLYSHNSKNLVTEGQTVIKGEPIAQIGSTGRSTGPHVHFEVKKSDRNINPVKYLYKKI
ncbi:MAG: murein DD-endopeptidase MepM/ murein hydrolase activator NlpD [Arenicella sp.]